MWRGSLNRNVPILKVTGASCCHPNAVKDLRLLLLNAFHLKDLHGQIVELPALRGKAVLLDFWSTECGPCIREMPNIQRIADKHKDELIVWGVSFDQPERDRKWLAQHQQEFATLSDTDYEVSDVYRVQGIPALVLMDATGIIRGYWEGEVPMENLEATLRRASRKK